VPTNETTTVFLQANWRTIFHIETNSFCIGEDKCCLSLWCHILFFSVALSFFSLPRRAPGSTQFHIQWVQQALPRGYSGQGAKLTTHFHLVLRLGRVELYLHFRHFFAAWYLIKRRTNFTNCSYVYRFTASSAAFRTGVRKQLHVPALYEYSSLSAMSCQKW
jgi:hypothetical protein